MPDKNKTSDKQDLPLEKVEDAVIVDDQTPADTDDSAPAEPEGKAEDTPPEPEIAEDLPQAEQGADDPVMGAEEPRTDTSDMRDKAEPAAASGNAAEKVIIRKGGFVPMFLGGVAAAAIGFGLARSGVLEDIALPGFDRADTQMADVSEQISAQNVALSSLDARLSALEDAPVAEADDRPDPTPLIEDLGAQIGELAQRITALEDRPIGDAGGIDDEAQQALATARAELDEIRTALESQRSQITALTAEAAREEEAAQLTARTAMQRAALSRIQTALDSGIGYSGALTDLQDTGVDLPRPLVDQAERGVPTLGALQAAFPDAARDALRVARQEAGGSGVGGFLQTQLGLRSLEPRQGDDPDAVLSRAEAALRDGRLSDALAELQGLSGSAQAEMADWQAQAETRLATMAAAQDLAQSLNAN